VVIDEIEEFDGDNDAADIKEFDYNDLIEDSKSQSPAFGQQNSPFKKCGTTYPTKKRYCNIVVIS
jgi:hypothetical protein